MLRRRLIVVGAVIVIAVLVVLFSRGGDAQGLRSNSVLELPSGKNVGGRPEAGVPASGGRPSALLEEPSIATLPHWPKGGLGEILGVIESEGESAIGHYLIMLENLENDDTIQVMSEGEFRVGALEPGAWSVAVYDSSNSPADGRVHRQFAVLDAISLGKPRRGPLLGRVIVQVVSDEQLRVTVKLGQPSGELARLIGYVVGASLADIADYKIYLQVLSPESVLFDSVATVEEDGRFDFGLIPQGVATYSLSAKSSSARGVAGVVARGEVVLRAGTTEVVTIAVDNSSRILLEVFSALSGGEVEEANVYWATMGEGRSGGMVSFPRYTRLELKQGDYVMLIVSEGHLAEFRSISVESPEGVISVVLEGIVGDEYIQLMRNGSPVPGAHVRLVEVNGMEVPQTVLTGGVCDDSGRIESWLFPGCELVLEVYVTGAGITNVRFDNGQANRTVDLDD